MRRNDDAILWIRVVFLHTQNDVHVQGLILWCPQFSLLQLDFQPVYLLVIRSEPALKSRRRGINAASTRSPAVHWEKRPVDDFLGWSRRVRVLVSVLTLLPGHPACKCKNHHFRLTAVFPRWTWVSLFTSVFLLHLFRMRTFADTNGSTHCTTLCTVRRQT